MQRRPSGPPAGAVAAILRDEIHDPHATGCPPHPRRARLGVLLAAPVVEVLVQRWVLLAHRQREPVRHRVVGRDAVHHDLRAREQNVT